MKTTHTIRKNHVGDRVTYDYAKISLPAIPGVVIDGDRSETDPNTLVIKTKSQRVRGAALTQMALRRVNMFRSALLEVAREDNDND